MFEREANCIIVMNQQPPAERTSKRMLER